MSSHLEFVQLTQCSFFLTEKIECGTFLISEPKISPHW